MVFKNNMQDLNSRKRHIVVSGVKLTFFIKNNQLYAKNTDLATLYVASNDLFKSISLDNITDAEFNIVDGWYVVNAYITTDDGKKYSCLLRNYGEIYHKEVSEGLTEQFKKQNAIMRFFGENSYRDQILIHAIACDKIKIEQNEAVSSAILAYFNSLKKQTPTLHHISDTL